MIQQVTPILFRSRRPGYERKHMPGGPDVPKQDVEQWLDAARRADIRSIICLLGPEQLQFYEAALPEGLVEHYRRAGFEVAHIPTTDHVYPPLDENQLEQVRAAFQRLPKPVLIHCSAGVDRTGYVVEDLQERGLAG